MGASTGVEQGDRGDRVRRRGRARIESDPADRQQRGADRRVDEVAGRHVLPAEPAPLAQEQGADQARDAGVDVHHRPAGEVQHVVLAAQEAAAPDPVRDRRIDQQVPERHEQQEPGELHPLGEGAGDQGGRDDREGELVGEVEVLGQALGAAVGGVGPTPFSMKACRLPIQSLRRVRGDPEGQAVADDEPEHRDQGRDRHLLGHGRQYVLSAHHAAVEQGQAGQGHHQDERRGGDHPGGPARIEL